MIATLPTFDENRRIETRLTQRIQILMVEDNACDAELLVQELHRAQFDPQLHCVHTEADFLRSLRPDLDLVISDYKMPQFSGLRALNLLRKRGYDIPFILISGTTGEEMGVEAIRQGAADFLLKDRLGRLGPAIRQALEQSRLRRENKQAEESLKLFRTLVDRSNDAIEVVDAETGRFLDVNETACLRLGYTREEMLSLSLPDITAVGENPFSLPAKVEEIRKTGFKIIESRDRRKDGSTFPVEINVQYIDLNRGYLISVVRDITERKRTEEKMAQQAAFLDKARDAIVAFDLERKILFWNKGAERMYGWTREEVVGRDISELFGTDPEMVKEAREVAIRQGEWRGERQHPRERLTMG